MTHIDVFNGDADGICALVQLRNAQPVPDQELVTGVKRDIQLLSRVSAGPGDALTVLDVSLDKNRDDLLRLLAAGAEMFYADHHFAGAVPESPRLAAHIDTDSTVCTSLIVNRLLEGRFAAWAVVGAFGDNLATSALALAAEIGLGEDEVRDYEALGTYLNYNGYGESLGDLHFDPADLYKLVSRHASPRSFLADDRAVYQRVEEGYRQDMAAAAAAVRCDAADDDAAVVILPCAPWARRVSGVFSNDLANRHPDRAHAVLTQKAGEGYVVSVRAPLSRRAGADALCRRFATGGGRAAAAGINHLPDDDLAAFVDAFRAAYATARA